LAEEAAETAQVAAEEARRNAQAFARDAEQQARQAEVRVSRADRARGRAEATARQNAAATGHVKATGDLQDYTKSDLMELASTIGIDGRTRMAKGELITAIREASRASRSRSGA
jgi:colicin import membrane protein